MVILSDEEEEQTLNSPQSTKQQYSGELDASNPLGFIISAMEFALRESKNDTLLKDVNAYVHQLVKEEKKYKAREIAGNGND